MKKIKKWLFPSLFKIIVCLFVTIIGLLFIFTNGYSETTFAYIFYSFSFYSLLIFILYFYKNYNNIKNKFIISKLFNTAFIQNYQNDLTYRKQVSLIVSLVMNLFYVIFKGGIGIYYKSLWEMVIAIYYGVLSIIRLNLLRVFHKTNLMDNDFEIKKSQMINSIRTGYLMIVLNLAMSGMVIQMIYENKSYEYPGWIIYGSATYTFYSLIHVVVNAFRFRKIDQPLINTSTLVSLVSTFMSLLALQTGMISTFGSSAFFQRIMNTITSTFVMIFELMIAIYMIRIYKKQLKRLLKGES